MGRSTNQHVSPLRPDLSVETKPSQYDRANAALITGILLAGFLFTVTFCIWFTGAFDFSGRDSVIIVPPTPDGTDPPPGISEDILEPGVQDFPELATPQLAVALASVTDVVSTVHASIDTRTGTAFRFGPGLSDGHRKGINPGPPGPIGVPDYKRWAIEFEAKDIETYKKQLRFLEIDVAAIHKTENDIWRVQQTDAGTKVIPSTRSKENKTLRFGHKANRMRAWDSKICQDVGIEVGDVVTSHFYPVKTRTLMATVEAAVVKAAKRKLEEVAKTKFKVVENGEGYQFEVVEITYR